MDIINDPGELGYISEIVNQVLREPQKLGSVEDFQTAIKKLSLKKGREVQSHLMAHPQEKAIGVSFSFADNPAKMTPTLSWLTPHQIVAATPSGNSISSEPTQAIVPWTANRTELAAKETQVMANSQSALEPLKSPSSERSVRALASFANQLAARNQLDGLWLTGLSLSAIALVAGAFNEKPIDKQASGEAIVRRFQQLLPERFDQLSRGEGEIQPFTWKDPKSGKRYRFEFGIEKNKNDAVRIHLSGFELAANKCKCLVFQANSLDGARRWAICQNDFSPEQLKSLLLAEKSADRGKLPKTIERES